MQKTIVQPAPGLRPRCLILLVLAVNPMSWFAALISLTHKVSSDLEKLTPTSRLVSSIDAAALEEAGIPSLSIPATVIASKKRAADAESDKKDQPPIKRKIQKSKKPKDFKENKKMDPERWLPLRDRSTYQPKGKKEKKKVMEMT